MSSTGLIVRNNQTPRLIMKKPHIIITKSDHDRLSRMIALGGMSPRERGEIHALKEELQRAEIVPPDELPADVISMNSRAELLDLDTGERMQFTVVYPGDANIDEGKISVLAPVGTGMLGYRVGDVFKRPAPYGVRRLKVTEVHFQPEAALAAPAA
jgi:regulator of nucleoside diphosphate kinase